MRLPLPARGGKRLGAIVAYGLAAIVVLAVGSSYLLRHSVIEKSLNGAGVQIVTSPNGSYTLKVPVQQVPKTPSAIENAPAVQVLPAHWEGGASAPGAPDEVALTPSARARLSSAVLGFLQRWETFPALPSGRDYARWKRALAPFIASGSDAEVYERQESLAPAAIGPRPPATIGSTWYTGYPSTKPITVRQLQDGLAYVTAYGLVRYHDPQGTLDGKLQLREYGLIMRLDASGWHVQRVVADSLNY
jgi:hypothetical protein